MNRTLKILKPIVRFSPWPMFLWIFMSLCCKEIRTWSTSFVTSKTYCSGKKTVMMLHNSQWDEHVLTVHTCGFCRNVCLWLAQPPQRFNRGSACLLQLPKCTTSYHLLCILITEVLMRRQTSASVKNLHQSVNDILWTQIHYRMTSQMDFLHIVWQMEHSPKLSIISHCDAKVSSFSVTNLWPLFRAGRKKCF